MDDFPELQVSLTTEGNLIIEVDTEKVEELAEELAEATKMIDQLPDSDWVQSVMDDPDFGEVAVSFEVFEAKWGRKIEVILNDLIELEADI